MKRLADPYRDLDVIDSRAPRFNQTVIGVLAAVAVATGWWWLLAALGAQLVMAGIEPSGISFAPDSSMPVTTVSAPAPAPEPVRTAARA